MTNRKPILAALGAVVALSGCATYGPPPPGYVGEGWRAHVRRCLRHYPNYNPATDLVQRPNGVTFRCPL